MTKEQKIVPGKTRLATWRAIYNGAPACLCESARAGIEASATAVDTLVESGRAVYGLNTGFGKLANVRISDADLRQLQKNLVMSHMTGMGRP